MEEHKHTILRKPLEKVTVDDKVIVVNLLLQALFGSEKSIVLIIDADHKSDMFASKNFCKKHIREAITSYVEHTFSKDDSYEEDCDNKGAVASPYPKLH